MNKNEKPKIRIALIGSGFSATFHIENYKRVHGIEVEFAGVFSRDNQKAKDFAQNHQINKVYNTLEDLLQDETLLVV